MKKKEAPVRTAVPARNPDLIDAMIDKIQELSLRGLLDKVTDEAEGYHAAKDKHVEKVVKMAKDPAKAKGISEYFDRILKACSKGSLTRADHSIKIMKVCYILHEIMRRGTAQAYKNIFGNYPDIFELPQISLPKTIPSSCVEARIAVAYASYLNTKVRLRQQDSLPTSASNKVKAEVLSAHGLSGISMKDLFEKGMACRFYRKRDFSQIFPRDTIHLFQSGIISDLLQHFDRFREEGEKPEEFEKREKQMVSWAERMQSGKQLCDAEYNRLTAIRRGVERKQVQVEEEEERKMAMSSSKITPTGGMGNLIEI